MTIRSILAELLLPPVGLLTLALVLAVAAWRGRRGAGLAAALLLAGQLMLATPLAVGALEQSLLSLLPSGSAAGEKRPQAIVVLSAELVRTEEGWTVGPLTLERMLGAAQLARRTGLPLLVTGGPYAGERGPSLAEAMAARFAKDFGLPVRWVEPRAADTWRNARLSAELLRRDGVETVFVVSHGWHLPRALLAFRGTGLTAVPAPLRRPPPPDLAITDFLPRADRWGQSWLMLREWAGLAVYAARRAAGHD